MKRLRNIPARIIEMERSSGNASALVAIVGAIIVAELIIAAATAALFGGR